MTQWEQFLERLLEETHGKLETTEFQNGVVDGYHEAGLHLALEANNEYLNKRNPERNKTIMIVMTPEELTHYFEKKQSDSKFFPSFSEAQKQDWIRGFIAGYCIRVKWHLS